MRLLSVFGVTLRLNIFFLLLFIAYWFLGVFGQALIIFSVVFLHEMAHVVVSLGYGLRVTEVELLPFGGVARIEGNFELNPVTESCIAVAGPLTNAFLYGLGLILIKFDMGNQQWLPFFIRCNLMLGFFNLLPALPLDGGRVLRACLSLRLGIKRATEISADLSKYIGVVMSSIGVWSVVFNKAQDFNFLLIAVFLMYFSVREKGSAMYLFMKFLARKKEDLLKEGILLSRQVVALESAFLRDVVKFFVPKKYHIVVVLNHDHSVRGTLTEGEVINGMLGKGPDTVVGSLFEK